jgi:hypothetical protein
MSKMKDLVIGICEDYQSSMSLQDIASKYDMSVTQAMKVVQDFGFGYYPPVFKESPILEIEE